MKCFKFTGILCALLLAGTAAGCTVSDQPLTSEPIISASSEPDVAVQESSAGNADAQQTPSGDSKPAENNGGGSPAQNADDPGTPSQQGGEDAPAQQDPEEQASSGNDYKIGSEPTLSIGVITAQPGQKSVPVSVKISNNPGYSFGGIRLLYDKKLSPKLDSDEDPAIPVYDVGPAASKAMTDCAVSPENRIVAFGVLSQKDCTEDGILFTAYFDIPADAASGTVYKLETGVERMINADSQPINLKLVGGEIRVQ